MTEIVKRDGRLVPYDRQKIEQAVFRCLKVGMGYPEADARELGERVAVRVDNVLRAGHQRGGRRAAAPPTVEGVQDEVERMLVAEGLLDEALCYRNYRNEHRLKRSLRPITAEEEEWVARNQRYFPEPLGIFQFLTKYARWQEDAGRRETWEECVDRALTFLQGVVARKYPEGVETITQTGQRYYGNPLPESDPLWAELRAGILSLEAMPAMRLLQMAGPAAERCNVSVFNCSFTPIDDLQSFAEVLYILMQGSGAGYSVESIHVDKLPRIKHQTGRVHEYFIPDSTEGWCDSLLFLLTRLFDGEDVIFDYSGIRPKGARLRTKGGRSSGPDPLRDLHQFVRKTVLARQGKILTTADALRILCKIGVIVQVGGVRRASEIALCDLEDDELRYLKRGAYWERGEGYLSEVNISAVYEERPKADAFLREWSALVESGTGERGLFNRGALLGQMPEHRRRRARETWDTDEIPWGTNPCGEIVLPPRGFCNLSIAVARPEDTERDLMRKVRLATILGTLQSLCTDFRYLRREWQENAEAERLLGVDIAGQLDCRLLRPTPRDHPEYHAREASRKLLLTRLRNCVRATNAALADRLGIYVAAAATCGKPGGNSGVMLHCSNLSPWEGKFILRRTRSGATDPVSHLLIAEGVPYQAENDQDPENPATWVFSWPWKAPEGAIIKGELSALEQLENWLVWKRFWCEHNPSVTIYVPNEEWMAVGAWVYEHWEWVGGLTFMPETEHAYRQTPEEAISQEEYEQMLATFPEINWAKLAQYDSAEDVNPAKEKACVAGACAL